MIIIVATNSNNIIKKRTLIENLILEKYLIEFLV